MTGISGFNTRAESDDSRADRPGAIVVASGELDLLTAPELRREIFARLEAGESEIVVEASAVEFIDATGIGVLIGAANAARGAGGRLVLHAPSPAVSWLLDILGLDGTLRATAGPSDASGRHRPSQPTVGPRPFGLYPGRIHRARRLGAHRPDRPGTRASSLSRPPGRRLSGHG
jgi:anti-sigma B factor antagonist